MRIAIPVAQGQLCMHFGQCEQFALVDADTERETILNVEQVAPPPHEPGILPAWLHERGVSVVIAGGMGQRAQQLFADSGIEVVVGASAADPEVLARAFLVNRLEVGENVCDH